MVAETLWIYADESRTTKVQIDSAFLRREQLNFENVVLTIEERALAARYARDMDDGEAQTLAVASVRRVAALSDDNALARVAATESVTVVSTLDLLAAWGTTQNDPVDELAAAAYAMYRRANYAPPRSHPRRAWYLGLIASRGDS